jgi:hypothetical protein
MPRKTRDNGAQRPSHNAPMCEVEGCQQEGQYKAPRSREQLDEYRWLCIDHIREHNKQWDYFADMKPEEIEAFMHDAVTGHRPTWTREERMRFRPDKLHDALYEFMHDRKRPAPQPAIPAKVRRSLALLEMEFPYTQDQLKSCYRKLAKRYHPDTNQGNKAVEETFKNITAAYKYLDEQLKKK